MLGHFSGGHETVISRVPNTLLGMLLCSVLTGLQEKHSMISPTSCIILASPPESRNFYT